MSIDFNSLPRRELEAGETLFEEGDSGNVIYMLQDGELGVYFGETQVAVINERTGFVGEMSALTSAPRSATVKALSQTTLVELRDPEAMIRDLPQLGFRLARGLATRLQNMNTQYKQLRAKLPGRRQQTDVDDEEMKTDLVDALDRLFDTTL